MTGPTELDGFWAEAQIALADLPRPWDTFERLDQVDPKLYRQLIEGERWLVRQTDISRVLIGWAQWLKLYRQALSRLHEGAPNAQ